MPAVRRFTHSLIQRFLDSKDLKYYQDEDDSFLVHFSYDDDTQCELTVVLSIQGDQQDIYTIYVFSSKKIPKRDWGRAILICNQWNEKARWPKAYLHIDNVDRDKVANIHLEENIDLEPGIHQELLDQYTDAVISSAFGFWQWATQEQEL